MGLLSVSSTISCGSRAMEGGDGRAFGRVAADHAVPVLVAAAPPRAVRVGEIRGHARFVAQLGVPGELGAVVMRHPGAGGGRQPGEHGLLRRHARPVAHLNPDDPPFLFRQVRIHLVQGATPLRLAIRTISNLTDAALSIRQRGVPAF